MASSLPALLLLAALALSSCSAALGETAFSIDDAKETKANVTSGPPRVEPDIVNSLQASTEFTVSYDGGQGWVKAPMLTGFNTACFLTSSVYSSSTALQVGCKVVYNSDAIFWYLYAYSGTAGSQSECSARCIVWS